MIERALPSDPVYHSVPDISSLLHLSPWDLLTSLANVTSYVLECANLHLDLLFHLWLSISIYLLANSVLFIYDTCVLPMTPLNLMRIPIIHISLFLWQFLSAWHSFWTFIFHSSVLNFHILFISTFHLDIILSILLYASLHAVLCSYHHLSPYAGLLCSWLQHQSQRYDLCVSRNCIDDTASSSK